MIPVKKETRFIVLREDVGIVEAVDSIASRQGVNRSSFIRMAIRRQLDEYKHLDKREGEMP